MKKFPAASGPDWGARGRYAAALIGVALAYFALAKLGLQLASINPSPSPTWALTGISLAALLLVGPRIWPAIFIGAFAAKALVGGQDTFATPV